MTRLVGDSLTNAKRCQKWWYNRITTGQEFQTDDQVLVLLLTSTDKLLTQWQGPYRVEEWVGKVKYSVDMHDHRKRRRTFHINMRRKWHTPVDTIIYIA